MRLADEQMAAELYALRETLNEDFAARLDQRVRAGFPTAKKKSGDRELTWRLLAPVLTGLAAIAVVAVVASNSTNSEQLSNDSGKRATPEAIAPAPGQDQIASGQQTKAGAVAGNVAAPSPTPVPGSRPRNAHTQIQELSAALGLSTDGSKLQSAADGVVEMATRYDGFVDSSDVHVGGSNGHAFFQLRIPAAHLREALDDLSGLGRVVSRDEGSTNVTGAYVDAGKAYHRARATVDSLLAQLRDATDPAEAASIRQQLVTARQQLVAAREALRGLKGRVTYAPVTVQIRANGDGNWSVGDAAGDAGDILEAIAGGTLVTLAVLVPLTALLALGWLGGLELNRRRREAALD
jgi:Domain of unknown function (DUF4349)